MSSRGRSRATKTSSSGSVATTISDWICPKCTQLNSTNTVTCGACSTVDPQRITSDEQNRNRMSTTDSDKATPKNAFETLIRSQSTMETDCRPRLFSPGCPIRCGTSGYSYKRWHQGPNNQNYYPNKDEFGYYCGEFDTVEVNSTFYHIPLDATFKNWAKKAPRPSFLYTVKANKFFTHMKKLIIDEAWTDRWNQFWTKCKYLGSHLGPVLFQFPPSFKNTSTTLSRLNDLAQVLPRDGQFAFEFRDASWFCDQVYLVMKKNNWCLCVIDCENSKNWCGNMPSGTVPADVDDHKTCDWGVYYRFHGPTGQYTGVYGAKRMRELAQMTKKHFLDGAVDNIELFFYFNNTDSHSPPAAVQDCRHLAQAFKDLKIMPQ